MDHHRFDALARTLAAGTASRRTLVAAILGSAVGAAFIRPGAGQAAADCRGLGDRCTRDLQCCGGSVCKRGECRCLGSFTRCGRRCYDLQADVRHCGKCGRDCDKGEICINGRCIQP